MKNCLSFLRAFCCTKFGLKSFNGRRHCEVLDEGFEWSRHCEGSDSDEATPRGPILHEIKRFRQKEAIHGSVKPKEEIQKTLTASHYTGLPRYADATLAMTAVQSMKKAVNQRATVTLNLFQGLKQGLLQILKQVQNDGCTLKTFHPRRLGFNPTSSHATFSLPRVTLNSAETQSMRSCHPEPKKLRISGSQGCGKKAAFSLVEMLMALLVASLLLAALAPVMTKRMDEAKINISGVGAAQYDKDSIISIFTNDSGEIPEIFNVPNDVNAVKVTMIGGGGAGGNSFYGKQEVTTSKSWTVPEGVSKLRVFMLGGGGGGASGGLGTGTATIPAGGDGNTYKDFLTPGETSFTIPSTATKVPDLDEKCSASGVTTWTGVTDGKEYAPGKVAVSVTACGGGGGGGSGWWQDDKTFYGGGGGSGGYVQNVQLLGDLPSSVYIKIPAGGGEGGGIDADSKVIAFASVGYYAGGGGGNGFCKTSGAKAGIYGGDGGTGSDSSACTNGLNGQGNAISSGGLGGTYTNAGCAGGNGGIWGGGGGGGGVQPSTGGTGGGGGGGGGPTTISTASGTSGSLLFQIGGGGGGGGSTNKDTHAGGGGGGGGGYGSGGGGGGAGGAGGGSYGNAGTYLSSTIGIGTGLIGKSGANGKDSNGGAGGGGYGGMSSNGSIGGAVSTIFGANHCNGGNGASATANTTSTSGKPGALRLYYTYPALKCDFSLPANGSGGGGAGQLVVGEINVTPGETLYFEIGSGGAVQNIAGKNGNNGNPTRIRRGSSTGPVIAEALGGFAGHYSSAETTESQGGTFRTNIAIGEGNTLDNNWTGISYNLNSGYGENGKLHTALLNKAYGGSGGNSQNMKGETLQGGTGGNSVKNGSSPLKESYGAGGGGGSGSQSEGGSTFGIGASGASGYVYFEYGGTNGGGGTTGELITRTITNLKAGTEIKIWAGAGGEATTGTGNGADSKIEYQAGASTKTLSARGGLRGNDGGMGKNEHAAEKTLPCSGTGKYANCSDPLTKGQAATPTYGGIGGYLEQLYQNPDETWATYIKAKDGTIGGPILGGCGGNLTTLMAGITCNDAANTPNGKAGTFGGGGGGGAVVNETGGLGGKGGKGMVILEYKSTSI